MGGKEPVKTDFSLSESAQAEVFILIIFLRLLAHYHGPRFGVYVV